MTDLRKQVEGLRQRLEQTVAILCETRGHEGRRPCRYCTDMQLWGLEALAEPVEAGAGQPCFACGSESKVSLSFCAECYGRGKKREEPPAGAGQAQERKIRQLEQNLKDINALYMRALDKLSAPEEPPAGEPRQSFIIARLPKFISDWKQDSKKYPPEVRAAYLFCAARIQLLLEGTDELKRTLPSATPEPESAPLESEIRDIIRHHQYGTTDEPLDEFDVAPVQDIVEFIERREEPLLGSAAAADDLVVWLDDNLSNEENAPFERRAELIENALLEAAKRSEIRTGKSQQTSGPKEHGL